MIYYIDGYNLLFALFDVVGDLALDRQRCLEAFYQQIEFLNLSLVVVFDAYKQVGEFSRIDYKKIELVYTAYGQKADDFIIGVVKRSKKPQQKVVVTNDLALAREVCFLNGQALKLDEFFKFLKNKRRKAHKKADHHLFDENNFENYLQIFTERYHKKDSPRE